jgi:hypothetical protein
MNIFNFTKSFPNEEACILHFKAQREQAGVVCSKCGSKQHYWLKNKLSYECKQCHSRQSLRSGTVLEHTRLPFMYWYLAMHFLANTKKSFSSSELQRQLGHKRYQPIWKLVCKLRDVTGKRDDLYKSGGQVELDNAFITTLIPDEQKDEDLKRGAGSQNKSKVTVMTGCTAVENPKPTMPPKRVNHIKMQIVTGLKAYTAAKVVKEQIDSQAELTADDSTTFYYMTKKNCHNELKPNEKR